MTSPLRIALAEDEPLNLRRLARLLQEAGCEVAAACPDGEALQAWLEEGGEADALFLDIQMPGLDGLSLAAQVPHLPVVFVTAHRDHAAEAFDLDAGDFLLKPVTAERLGRALDRIRRKLPQPPSAQRRSSRFPVQAGEGLIFMDVHKISHFEVKDELVWAFAGERFKTLWHALGEVEAHFPEIPFLRIQRHLLLRPEAVLGLRPASSGRLLARVAGGAELEVSRGATPRLKALLGLSGKDVDRG